MTDKADDIVVCVPSGGTLILEVRIILLFNVSGFIQIISEFPFGVKKIFNDGGVDVAVRQDKTLVVNLPIFRQIKVLRQELSDKDRIDWAALCIDYMSVTEIKPNAAPRVIPDVLGNLVMERVSQTVCNRVLDFALGAKLNALSATGSVTAEGISVMHHLLRQADSE